MSLTVEVKKEEKASLVQAFNQSEQEKSSPTDEKVQELNPVGGLQAAGMELVKLDASGQPTEEKVEELPAVQKIKQKKEKKQAEKIPLWCCLGDDDDEDDNLSDKKMKKFQPWGKKQTFVLLAGNGVTLAAGAFFYDAPLLPQEFAGGTLALNKKAIVFIPKDKKWLARTVAIVVLPAAYATTQLVVYLGVLSATGTPAKVLLSIPWIYPTLGMLRSDSNEKVNLKNLENKVEFLKNHPKVTQILDASAKMAVATSLILFAPWRFLNVGAGVIYKGEARRLVDIAEEKILKLKGEERSLSLTAFFGTLGITTTAGVLNLIYGEYPALSMVLIIPAVDTLFRTIKTHAKRVQNERKDAEKKLKKLEISPVESSRIQNLWKQTKPYLIVGALMTGGGLLAAQASKINDVTFVTALLIDLVSLVKVASKEVSPSFTISLESLYMLIFAGMYSGKEFFGAQINDDDEFFIAFLGLTAFMYSIAMYQTMKQVKPDKKPKVKGPKIEEMA